MTIKISFDPSGKNNQITHPREKQGENGFCGDVLGLVNAITQSYTSHGEYIKKYYKFEVFK